MSDHDHECQWCGARFRTLERLRAHRDSQRCDRDAFFAGLDRAFIKFKAPQADQS